jgi:hypothetical protein
LLEGKCCFQSGKRVILSNPLMMEDCKESAMQSTLTRENDKPFPGSVIDFPVVFRADNIEATDDEGDSCLRIAHVPATYGAAKDVPLATLMPPPGIEDNRRALP